MRLAIAGGLPKSTANLCLNDRMQLVLLKLKLGITNTDLAVRFDIPRHGVSAALSSHIDVTESVLSFLIPWPDRDTVNVNMPRLCKRSFPIDAASLSTARKFSC